MTFIGDHVLDNGLAALKSLASHVYINTTPEPTPFSAASSGATSLGSKNFGAGAVFPGALAAATPNGRKATSAAITDGVVGTDGTAATFSVTDNANSRLLATGTLTASQAVTSANPFTLTLFEVRFPSS